jgi:hypothetical protein
VFFGYTPVGISAKQISRQHIMKRWWALSLAFSCALGCATETDQAQWNEAMKDLRGDNMKMRTGKWGNVDNNDDTMPSLSNSPHRSSGLN